MEGTLEDRDRVADWEGGDGDWQNGNGEKTGRRRGGKVVIQVTVAGNKLADVAFCLSHACCLVRCASAAGAVSVRGLGVIRAAVSHDSDASRRVAKRQTRAVQRREIGRLAHQYITLTNAAPGVTTEHHNGLIAQLLSCFLLVASLSLRNCGCCCCGCGK